MKKGLMLILALIMTSALSACFLACSGDNSSTEEVEWTEFM